MPKSTDSGEVNCCLTQLLLDLRQITTVTPTELGDLLDITPSSAGSILKKLSWRRDWQRTGHAIYHYEGRDKLFSGQAVARARSKLARMLGISREELMAEVLAL